MSQNMTVTNQNRELRLKISLPFVPDESSLMAKPAINLSFNEEPSVELYLPQFERGGVFATFYFESSKGIPRPEDVPIGVWTRSTQRLLIGGENEKQKWWRRVKVFACHSTKRPT
ncbi:hypothetical protein TNCV_1853741 [Trichonephila clavipes]|nr:hypothetical protein TNCV_1853741 [Trichonephila clavipes]